ncbi:MAG: hypothetical protein WCV81_05535 [Microgenomates group bacterium]|jgi:hypothetical protein
MGAERTLPDFTLKQKVARTIGAGIMVTGLFGGGWGMSELYKLSRGDDSQARQAIEAQIPPISDEIVQRASVLVDNYEQQMREAARARGDELSKSYQILDQRKAYNVLYNETYLKPWALKAQAFGYFGIFGFMTAMAGYCVWLLASQRYPRRQR